MPATRQLKSFTVKTQDGKEITIQRRCAGTGELAQKQLAQMVYDEQTKKFRAPHVEKPKKSVVPTPVDSNPADRLSPKMAAKLQAKIDAEVASIVKMARLEAQVGVTIRPEPLVGTAVLSEPEQTRQTKHKKVKN